MDKTLKTDKNSEAILRLLRIMDELREKCPWDSRQNMESLRCNTIEEAYELSEAVIKKDMNEIQKELGDLLLHVVFYSKIGSEQNSFDFADVTNGICEKLIARHPHVFGNTTVNNDNEIRSNWEKIKLSEGRKSVLEGIPDSLPALIKAIRIQEKAGGIGFDWKEKENSWNKLKEEIEEFEEELKNGNENKMEAEFGDLMFSLVKCARIYGIQAENALEKTNLKFKERFRKMEELIHEDGKNIQNLELAEMEIYWKKSKQNLKQ